MAADVLQSNSEILLALTEGGWNNKQKQVESEESGGDNDLDGQRAENKMIQSILNSQNVSEIASHPYRITYCSPSLK